MNSKSRFFIRFDNCHPRNYFSGCAPVCNLSCNLNNFIDLSYRNRFPWISTSYIHCQNTSQVNIIQPQNSWQLQTNFTCT